MGISTETEPITPARSQLIRLAAGLGVGGQVALTVGWVVATLIQDGKYDAARDEMSDMAAIGVSHAWFVLAYMAFAGVTTILFAWGALRPLLSGAKGRTLAAVLLSLTWGLGNLSDGLFRIDCRVADGCTTEQQVQSWHAVVHASSSILFLPFLVTPFVVARELRRHQGWADLSRTSRWFGLAIVLTIVASVVLTGQWGAGYVQRLLLSVGAAWVGVLAVRAVHLARPEQPKRSTDYQGRAATRSGRTHASSRASSSRKRVIVKRTGAGAALMLGWLAVATACSAGGQDESPTSTASAGATEPSLGTTRDGFLKVPSGERLHYQCQGTGSPAIIIEAGTGSAGTQSFPPQFIDPLAEVTTVCTYDRPGTGSSDLPRTPPNHARAGDDQCDVEDGLIAGLGLGAPYVLMGQSGGGNLVIWCAARHPRQVAALVTIEAYHDDPVQMKKEDLGWRGNPDHVDYVRVTTELDRMRMPIGTFPVLVFSATQADPGGAQNQRYWLGLSPHSRQVVVEGGHDLHMDAPDKLAREILDLLGGLGATGADGTQ